MPFDLRYNLKTLLDRIDSHGHGGLLVLSATKPSGLESTSWPIRNDVYSLADVRLLRAESLARTRLSRDDPKRVSISELTRHQRSFQVSERNILDLSSSLALTDGAVWLDGTLRPRAFGLFAQLPSASRISRALDAAGTNLMETQFNTFGARHRAMVALANHNPGAPVIAISVDGGFSAALQAKAPADLPVWHFESSDLDADDPFNPQSHAFWNDLLRAVR